MSNYILHSRSFNNKHATVSFESSIVRSLNAFDEEGEEGESATVCLLKATYAKSIEKTSSRWNRM